MSRILPIVALVLVGCVDASTAEDPTPDTITCSSLEGTLRLGTMPPREPTGEFTRMMDGAAAPLEFGSQSSWMIVLAIQMSNLEMANDVTFVARVLNENGGVLSSPTKRALPVQFRDDGFAYAVDLFLPLEADDPVLREFGWDGQHASLELTATDACGDRTTVTLDVVLKVP